MKFYDKGFISKFSDYTEVQILSAGVSILKLKIYEDKVCKDTFQCQSSSSFNKEYLSKNYSDDFLKKLFDNNKKDITHRDKENKILIKIKKD